MKNYHCLAWVNLDHDIIDSSFKDRIEGGWERESEERERNGAIKGNEKIKGKKRAERSAPRFLVG